MPRIKLATFEEVNDLKDFIFKKDNDVLQKDFDIHTDQDVNDFIKEKIEEWDFCVGINRNEQGAFLFWWLFRNIFNEHDL